MNILLISAIILGYIFLGFLTICILYGYIGSFYNSETPLEYFMKLLVIQTIWPLFAIFGIASIIANLVISFQNGFKIISEEIKSIKISFNPKQK